MVHRHRSRQTRNRFTVALLVLACACHLAPADPVDPNFTWDYIDSSVGRTKIEFDHAGRMYVTEKRGRLLQYLPNGTGGFQTPAVLLDIQTEVNPDQESGLLGMALDPAFADNRFVYLFFTTDDDQRLVRYTLNSSFNGTETGSAVVLLSGLPRQYGYHKAGDIAIHPDDPYRVVIALGDDGEPSRAQDVDFYEGKFLRVDSSTGLGVADNPWFNGNPDSIRSRVWARGLRNPFRFVFHPSRADVVIISENGDGTDRVAWVQKGSNGQWGPQGDDGGFLSPSDPNFRVMHTTAPSLIAIAIATSGPFAHNGQPTLYLGDWFPTPWGVRRFTMSGADLSTLTSIPDGQGGNWWEESVVAVDFQFGPDGHLYFTETGGDDSPGGWYNLRRYRYAGGTPPTAGFTTSPANGQGEVPLAISFSDTSAPGTHALSGWAWDFGDGQTSAQQNPSHTYTAPGRYAVSLTVRDEVGLTATTQREVVAKSTTTVTLHLATFDGRVLPATATAAPLPVSLRQLDGLTPIAFAGGGGAEGNQITVPAGGTYSGTLALPLTGNGLVMVIADGNPGGLQAMTRGFLIPAGVAADLEVSAHLSDTALRGTVRTIAGEPAPVDLGVTSGGVPATFGGARDYLPASFLPATGVGHRITTDAPGHFYIGLPTSLGGTELVVTLAEDTGRGHFTSVSATVTVPASQAVNRDFILGEWRGGPGDDLSAIAVTPQTPFSAVQAIFSNNCIGCHRANTSNNGGLDLTDGNSLAELLNQPSLFVPGLKLVDPGNPNRSYLFEKINRATPQQGARMRPSDALAPADQAVIRAWIAQLAPTYESFVRGTLLAEPGATGTGVAEDFDQDGTANGLAYSGFQPSSINVTGGTATVEFNLDTNTSGLTLAIQGANDLDAGFWRTLAVRLRGGSAWRTAPGITILEPAPGLVRVLDTTAGTSSRFFLAALTEE